MNPRLSTRLQRAAALLLLALLAALFGSLLLRPFALAYQERNAAIGELQRQIRQYRIAADEQPRLAGQLQALQQEPLISRYSLQNHTPALAAAELQQQIQKAVTAHGGRLVSMQVIEPAPWPGLAMVKVRIRLRTDITGLQNLLFALASARPLISLDQVFLRVIGAGRSAGGDRDESLDVGFDASGYLPGETP